MALAASTLHQIGARWRWPVLLAVVVLLFALRAWLSLAWQFPAPTGDGVLFSSTSLYGCRTGVLQTPLYPLDPTGANRYVWHGILQPALLSFLNPGCSLAGSFAALAAIWLATAVLAWRVTPASTGRGLKLLFVVLVAAIQVKQGFRPEALALLIVVAAETLRARERLALWPAAASLLAWTHPTVFILYLGQAALTARRQDWRRLAEGWRPAMAALAAVQALLLVCYPFPLADLLQGLAQQGRLFAARTDGDLWTYYIRSDFLPLFGIALLASYATAVWRRPRLALMAPLIWFYGLRVPPAYYNLLALHVLLCLMLIEEVAKPVTAGVSQGAWQAWCGRIVLTSSLLGLVGVAQGDVRDLVNLWRYRADAAQAQRQFEQLTQAGYQACRVPSFFTEFLPADRFQPSMVATLRACESAVSAWRVDLLAPTDGALPAQPALCQPWPEQHALPLLARLARKDSGYSFVRCPVLPQAASVGLPAMPRP